MVATALTHRRVGLEAFTDERLLDPGIRALMRKVEVVREPAFDAGFPDKWTAEVEIETIDGARHVSSGRYAAWRMGESGAAVGDPRQGARPARAVVDASAAEALVSRVMSIEKVADARTMVPELERQSTPARTGAAQTADYIR